jgi:hypothetical protein
MISLLLAIALAGGQGQTTQRTQAPTIHECLVLASALPSCNDDSCQKSLQYATVVDRICLPAPVTEGAKKDSADNTTTTALRDSGEKSEAGRVKLSGVQDHAASAQVVGGGKVVAEGAETVKPQVPQDGKWHPLPTDPPSGYCRIDQGALKFFDCMGPPLIVPAVHRHTPYDQPPPWVDYWTCSDSKRVLLTSEDGEHYCMRVKSESR